jgi:transposase-like protein
LLRFVVSDTRQKDVIGCPRCKTAMEEVARIKPLQKVQGLIAYVCPSCRYTTSEILPAPGSAREE